MALSVASFRYRHDAHLQTLAEMRQRSVRRRLGVAWGLLFFNVMTFVGGQSVIPIPYRVGQAITQAALPVALLLVLSVNRRVVVRPNIFLLLMSLLVIEAFLAGTQPPYHIGTIYRIFRLAEFVAVLWLLTPWWGRRDLPLARWHLTAMSVVLGTVLAGMLVAPGRALNGRLGGVIWPIPSTQVAHYAAVTIGLVAVLWFCGLQRGRFTLLIVVVAGVILVLTHTRTALVGMVGGLLVASLSLIVAKARMRKVLAITGAVLGAVLMTLSGVIIKWLKRGQGAQQLFDFSGRTEVWDGILRFPRDGFQKIFGLGLSNDSFNGLAIDSNWFAAYQEQGLYGVFICAAVLLFLLVTACLQPRGVQRALALFLIIYCLVASFTEVGFADASTYLLDLTVAASLLVSPWAGRSGRSLTKPF